MCSVKSSSVFLSFFFLCLFCQFFGGGGSCCYLWFKKKHSLFSQGKIQNPSICLIQRKASYSNLTQNADGILEIPGGFLTGCFFFPSPTASACFAWKCTTVPLRKNLSRWPLLKPHCSWRLHWPKAKLEKLALNVSEVLTSPYTTNP